MANEFRRHCAARSFRGGIVSRGRRTSHSQLCSLEGVRFASSQGEKEEWSQQQEKAGKTKRLFDSLLEEGDPEAAKAAARAKARAAEDAADRDAHAEREAQVLKDPLVAGLLPAAGAGAEVDDENVDVENEDGGSDAELDELLGLKRRHAKRRNSKAAVSDTVEPSEGTVGSQPTATKAACKDSSLVEALQLIAGKAPAKVRKKRKQAAATAAADAASESQDEADADASTSLAPAKKKKKRRKVAM